MKKIILSLLITSVFLINFNSFGMLTCFLRNTRQFKLHRAHHSLLTLPRTNIFNAPYKGNNLLEDLYNRNNNTIQILETCILKLHQQNTIAADHVYYERPLDTHTLNLLEKQLQETLSQTK